MKKNNKGIMHVKEYRSKKGELSIQCYCSCYDPIEKESKLRVKSFKVPSEIKGIKELDAFKLKCQLEWKDECQKLTRGIIVPEKKDMSFYKYACGWVENLRSVPEGYNHYSNCLGNLKVFKEKLGNYLLSEMTLPVVLEFCKYLSKRTYTKDKVTVLSSLQAVIKDKKMTVRLVAQEIGISHCTVVQALKAGAAVSKKTATSICKFLGVPVDKYFKIESEEIQYSKSANRSLKIMLHCVLKDALMEGYISENYATRDNTKAVTGTEKEKKVLNSLEDVKEFLQCVEREQDKRKQTAFSILIMLGLRSAELVGLEWKDFNFNANEVYIRRNTIYVPSFGTVTKSPKSNTSKRILPLPDKLIGVLKEYKAWWDNQKINHGDLWEKTDRLFCQYSGKDMAGSTVAGWLKEFEIKNNLPIVSPHSLRHTYVSMLVVNDIDPKTASELAGHSEINTTLKYYTHTNFKAKRNAADKLNSMLAI